LISIIIAYHIICYSVGKSVISGNVKNDPPVKVSLYAVLPADPDDTGND